MTEREKHLLPIKLMVTETEKAELQAAADRASLRLAAYVRMVALQAARDEAMSAHVIPVIARP